MTPETSILLIDPYKEILNAYRMILGEEKYVVETSKDLDEAFQRLSVRQYSVIITEYFAQFDEIYNIILWVKQHSPETYMIMVSNKIIEESKYETLFNIGLDEFILKPFPPEKILVHIRKGIKQRELILKNKELEKQSFLDPLAQQVQDYIFKPIYFKKCLKQEIKKARRHRRPISLLILQIQEREKIGDRFEKFCMELAKIIRVFIREEDLFSRDNGTFIILLPETDDVGSRVLAGRLSNLIQSHLPFQSDEVLKPIAQALSFQIFTYPDNFAIPKSLVPVVEDINKEYSLL